jgi:hypothetical protein
MPNGQQSDLAANFEITKDLLDLNANNHENCDILAVNFENISTVVNEASNENKLKILVTNIFTYDVPNDAVDVVKNTISEQIGGRESTQQRTSNKIVFDSSTSDSYIQAIDTLKEEYRVDSPTLNKSDCKKKPMRKSKSLEDSTVQIQELSDSSSAEDTIGELPIVSEMDDESESECEFPDKYLFKRSRSVHSEYHEHNVHDNHTVAKKNEARESRAKKRAEIVSYFLPHYANLKSLDIIKEESSDNSDIDRKHETVVATPINCKKKMTANANAIFPKSNLDFSKRKQRETHKPHSGDQIREEPACFMVDIKVIEAEIIPEVCSRWQTNTIETEQDVETIFLASGSSSASDLRDFDDLNDAGNEDEKTDTSMVTPTIEFNDNLVLNDNHDLQCDFDCSDGDNSKRDNEIENNQIDNSDKIAANDTVEHKLCSNSEEPHSFLRQDSSNSNSSSKSHSTTTSQCTSRYIEAPYADFKEFDTFSNASPITTCTQLQTLKNLCLETIKQLPFSESIIKYLDIWELDQHPMSSTKDDDLNQKFNAIYLSLCANQDTGNNDQQAAEENVLYFDNHQQQQQQPPQQDTEKEPQFYESSTSREKIESDDENVKDENSRLLPIILRSKQSNFENKNESANSESDNYYLYDNNYKPSVIMSDSSIINSEYDEGRFSCRSTTDVDYDEIEQFSNNNDTYYCDQQLSGNFNEKTDLNNFNHGILDEEVCKDLENFINNFFQEQHQQQTQSSQNEIECELENIHEKLLFTTTKERKIMKPIHKEQEFCLGLKNHPHIKAPKINSLDKSHIRSIRAKSSTCEIPIDLQSLKAARCKSLPHQYDSEIEELIKKEIALQNDFQQLEQERKHLENDKIKFALGKICRQKNFEGDLSEVEVSRMLMHSEWQNKVAEREARKQLRIIKLTKPENKSFVSKEKTDIGFEFIDKVKQRRSKLCMPADSDWESGSESNPFKAYFDTPDNQSVKINVKILESGQETIVDNPQELSHHLKEFIEFAAHEPDTADEENPKDGESTAPRFIGIVCAVVALCWVICRKIFR